MGVDETPLHRRCACGASSQPYSNIVHSMSAIFCASVASCQLIVTQGELQAKVVLFQPALMWVIIVQPFDSETTGTGSGAGNAPSIFYNIDLAF